VAFPEIRPVAFVGAAIQYGMAGEGSLEPFGLEIRRLERKQGQQVIEKACDLGRTTGPPGPDARSCRIP